MALRPAPKKELTRFHGCPEQGRGAHCQPHHGSIRSRVIDMDDSVMLRQQRRLLDHMPNAGHDSSRAGASGKINNVCPAFQFEPAKQLHGTVNTTGERRVFHCPANLNIAASVSEVENLAPDFDAGHFFAKVNRPIHTPIPRFHAEQGDDRTVRGKFKINGLAERQP